MSFVTHTLTIDKHVEAGDLTYSNSNRALRQVRAFLLGTGQFTVYQEDVPVTEATQLVTLYRFKDTDIFLRVLGSLSITIGFQPYAGSPSIAVSARSSTISLPTSGFFDFKLTIGEHFFEFHSPSVGGVETSDGWLLLGPYWKTKYDDTILAKDVGGTSTSNVQFYSLIRFGQNFTNSTLLNKHYLLEPIFQKATPYNSTNASYFYVDEDVYYLGEYYHAPTSLGTLVANQRYSSATGKAFFASSFMNLLFVS